MAKPLHMTPHQNRLRTVISAMLLLLLIACGGGGGGSSDAGAGTGDANGNNTPVTPPPVTTAPPPAADTQITLLVLYSPGVQEQFSDAGLRASHLVNVANDVVAASGGNFRLSISHTALVDYPESLPIEDALNDMTHATHPVFTPVAAWRNQYAADLVILLRPYANDGRCGFAWQNGEGSNGNINRPGEADFGYSVVASNCSDYTLLHEVGHNLGLAHSRRQSPGGGTLPYAAGHGVDDEFVTVMATPGEFNAPRLPMLSNPQTQCEGKPCGVVHTLPEGADAVRALSATAVQAAAYR